MEKTLADLGVQAKPTLLVLNKADQLRDEDGRPAADYEAAKSTLAAAAGIPPPNVVLVSALKRWGLDLLLARVGGGLDGDLKGAVPAGADMLARGQG